MLKPQAIRDQEFEIKFRGYDPVEVKNYLELLADDFFELSEEARILQDKLDAATGAKERQARTMGTLESLEGLDDLTSDFDDGAEEREETLEEVQAKLVHAKSRVETLTTENMGYLSQIGDLSKQLEIFENDAAEEQKERERLMKQVTLLTQQNAELREQSVKITQESSDMQRLAAEIAQLRDENVRLRGEEDSLKKTLVSAQSFADSMRAEAERDAAGMIDDAKMEVEAINNQLEESVARLSAEIEALEEKKSEVRSELRRILEGYLAALDQASTSFSG